MSNITIDVKNDAMLGRINDGVIAVKLYSLEKQLEKKDKEIEEMKERWEELYKIIDLAVNGINKKGNKEEE